MRTSRRASHAEPLSAYPVYSILVPLFEESEMLPQLITALSDLAWPVDRLDIQLLIEGDDLKMWHAVQSMSLERPFRVTRIPPGGPRTKPNALNYGLRFARGELLCIYDAEDQPEPEQISVAALRFEQATPNVACLQAPLIGRPARWDGWISRQWSLEYAVQFQLILPCLARLNLPFLLGGTSNHFRTRVLRDLGGWDPQNVTEDAELSVRLLQQGFRLEVIDCPTYEAPPNQLGTWLAQRSRWLKGFTQTWAKLLYETRSAGSQLGAFKLFVLHLSLGGAVVAAVLYLPAALWVTLCLLMPVYEVGPLGWSVLIAGLCISALGDALAPGAWTWARCLTMLTRPFYYLLHSLSAFRAIWEWVFAPTYWAKTPHVPVQIMKGKADVRLES